MTAKKKIDISQIVGFVLIIGELNFQIKMFTLHFNFFCSILIIIIYKINQFIYLS